MRRGIGILLMAVSALVMAEPEGSLFPEALKGIQRAGSVCRADDIAVEPPIAHGGHLDIEPDLSCAIAPSDLMTELNSSQVLLADLRPAREYGQYRIDGALNLSYAELRTKAYWRNKTVVLVGSGKNERDLYVGCADLKRRGFPQVRVLHGGVTGWLSAGFEVIGLPPGLEDTMRLTATELWAEGRFERNVLLLTPSFHSMKDEVKSPVALTKADPEAVKVALKAQRKKVGGQLAAVVLALGPGVSGEQLRAIREAIEPLPMLVYLDSREALASALKVQNSVWAAHETGPKKPRCGL